MAAHGGDQLAGTRHHPGRGPGLFQGRQVETLQERDALAQGALEVDLAGHGARGDGGDAVADAGELCQLVQRLADDDRAVHVGDQQALASVAGRCHDRVDRRIAEGGAQGLRVRRGEAG